MKQRLYKRNKNNAFKLVHAFKNFAHACNSEISNSFDPKLQLKNAKFVIKNKLEKLLNELRGFKFVITLILKFKN